MATFIGSICRKAALRGDPLNILTFPTHEAYQTCLAATGHNFYMVQGPGIKTWNSQFRPVPHNHVLLDPASGKRQIPVELDFDLILSQNKFGQFPVAAQLSQQLHLPLVSLEHCLPVTGWTDRQIARLNQMRGDVNVFISEYSRTKWGWTDEASVVHHGIDVGLFMPPQGNLRDNLPIVLSVVNDWKNRNWCCGYDLWRESTRGLNVRVIGDTPGLSVAAPTVDALVSSYQSAAIFVNTSLVSPVPTALLEAMACGCAVVTTGTCMIPEVVRNGVNGLIADTPETIRAAIERLLSCPTEAQQLGNAARQTIVEKFSLGSFVTNWNVLLRTAANINFIGQR